MTVRRWVRVCSLGDLEPGRGVAALVDGQQVALFLLAGNGGEPAARLRAVDNRDPVSGAEVLSRGLVGSSAGVDYVASPMLKHRFDLASGRCLDGSSPGVRVWPVRVWGRTVEVLSVRDAASASDPVPTHCPFCALQCGVVVRTGADDEPEVVADPAFPVNEGRMCVKGWSAAGLLSSPERLLHPLVRDGRGRLRRATWDVALDELAGRLLEARRRHGAGAVGVFGSGALTNEKAYLLGKFARVALATPNIDYNGRYCMSSAAAASRRAFGLDRGLPFPLSDIASTDTLVLWGANPADTMPPLMQWIERRRGRLVVVDPRRSATAAVADEHVQPVPGTDLALALGLLHLAVQTGSVDERYISLRTTGWDAVRRSVEDWTPARVERHSGVPSATLHHLLALLVEPPTSMLLTGRGPEQQIKGTDTVSALINLMLALGRVGRPGSGFGCLTGQANGQGGREHGQKADQLPGYRMITDLDARRSVAEVWGVDPSELPGPGRSAVEMLTGIGEPGGIRALLVAGSDLAVASPDSRQVVARLRRLDTLAVIDAFPGETADCAHFLLPCRQWAEESGTVTNLEGRVLLRRSAAPAPAGVRSDLEIISSLAARLGHRDRFALTDPEEVFDELRRATAGAPADYSGITYQRLDAARSGDGLPLYWPCPGEGHPGTPRLFTERFSFPDGLARFTPVQWRAGAETVDRRFPLWFTTGRLREQYNSGNQTRRLARLSEHSPGPRLQIHTETADSLGIADGSPVIAESRRGGAVFEARVTADVRPDTVFAPFHWGGAEAANRLTSASLDPTSGMPEFKVCAVRVRPLVETGTKHDRSLF